MMIAHVSPAQGSTDYSLNSLRYAERLKASVGASAPAPTVITSPAACVDAQQASTGAGGGSPAPLRRSAELPSTQPPSVRPPPVQLPSSRARGGGVASRRAEAGRAPTQQVSHQPDTVDASGCATLARPCTAPAPTSAQVTTPVRRTSRPTQYNSYGNKKPEAPPPTARGSHEETGGESGGSDLGRRVAALNVLRDVLRCAYDPGAWEREMAFLEEQSASGRCGAARHSVV